MLNHKFRTRYCETFKCINYKSEVNENDKIVTMMEYFLTILKNNPTKDLLDILSEKWSFYSSRFKIVYNKDIITRDQLLEYMIIVNEFMVNNTIIETMIKSPILVVQDTYSGRNVTHFITNRHNVFLSFDSLENIVDNIDMFSFKNYITNIHLKTNRSGLVFCVPQACVFLLEWNGDYTMDGKRLTNLKTQVTVPNHGKHCHSCSNSCKYIYLKTFKLLGVLNDRNSNSKRQKDS